MMFPTAVKGHIPFAPTYSERVEKHQQERRRRSNSGSGSSEKVAKRKPTSSTKIYSLSKRSGSTCSAKVERNAMSLGELETSEERITRSYFSSDSQIAADSTFRKTNELNALSSPTERNRKRASFLRVILNLFQRRTRLSIDVRTHSENREVEHKRHNSVAAASTAPSTGRCTAVSDNTCDCDGSTGQTNTNCLASHQPVRQRRSNTQRLESILEEDAESDVNLNENDIENEDEAVDEDEIGNRVDNDTESDSAIDVLEDETTSCVEQSIAGATLDYETLSQGS